MYLAFIDESGTHNTSPALVVAGLVIHEEDAWHLQQRLDSYLYRKLLPLGHDHTRFELHAVEMRRGTKEWAGVDEPNRLVILRGAYAALAGYAPVDTASPHCLMGAVVQRHPAGAEQRAYELVMKKFDDFVARRSRGCGQRQRGLIIHDRSNVEGRLQQWTSQWRTASCRLGQLRNLADIPLFADSRATRLLQAADLVSYGLFSYYASAGRNDRFTQRLWPLFDSEDGRMHGLIHDGRDFASCECPPCTNRRSAAAAQQVVESTLVRY